MVVVVVVLVLTVVVVVEGVVELTSIIVYWKCFFAPLSICFSKTCFLANVMLAVVVCRQLTLPVLCLSGPFASSVQYWHCTQTLCLDVSQALKMCPCDRPSE